jgi:hypothetical protein
MDVLPVRFLETLSQLCEKYTNAAAIRQSDITDELDFSKQVYLKQGQLVSGEFSDGETEDGEKESMGIVIHWTPKKVQNCSIDLDKLPTDILETMSSEADNTCSPMKTELSVLETMSSKADSTCSPIQTELLSGDEMLKLLCTLSPADKKTRSPFVKQLPFSS